MRTSLELSIQKWCDGKNKKPFYTLLFIFLVIFFIVLYLVYFSSMSHFLDDKDSIFSISILTMVFFTLFFIYDTTRYSVERFLSEKQFNDVVPDSLIQWLALDCSVPEDVKSEMANFLQKNKIIHFENLYHLNESLKKIKSEKNVVAGEGYRLMMQYAKSSEDIESCKQ